ncbi:TIGR01906 family membrane protein [Clostridium sp. ZS2-4]|uniref:TIGR01906 family membrane protein n=1 Tax=Clostridium sp. ZS2-4 TaxID=2987703 RepID=UPI00227C65ED|nr:TIGR01906 family membrane protein [Clostridium sp. ZS2-4]MCY6355838.1 TIGR01906 family membrane protein [Clostridium sp. ZS2-4]
MIKINIKNILFEILLTFCITLLIIILSVKITLNFKPLYYMDIITLNVQETSNLSSKEIKLNYNYVINYVQSHQKQNFVLPTLTFSNQGKIHFEEVKAIFNKLDYILYTLILIDVIIIYINIKTDKRFRFLKWSSIFLFLAPFLCLIPFLLNFDKSFTIFHKLLFNNDYWLLDPKLDPIINIMPQEFFFHCAILIISLMFVFSSIFYIIFKKLDNYFSFL